MRRKIDIYFQINEIKERFDFNIEVDQVTSERYYRTVSNGIIKNYFDTEDEVAAYLAGVFDLLVLNQYKCLSPA